MMLSSSFFSKILQLSGSGITGSYNELTNFCSKDLFCKVRDLKHYEKSPPRVILLLNLSLEISPVLRSTLWFLILENLHAIPKSQTCKCVVSCGYDLKVNSSYTLPWLLLMKYGVAVV